MTPPEKPAEGALAEVRIAKSPSEQEQVFRCRYEVFTELWGKKPPAGDAKRRLLQDGLDESATLLYIEREGEIAGTVRLNWLHKTPFSDRHREVFGLNRFFQRFPPECLSMSSQLFVAKKWRDTDLVPQLLGFAYTLARESEVQFDFRLCTPSLLAFYELLGYRRYKEDVREPDGGHRVPLVCVMEDVAYLEKVDSPFYQLARRYENSREAAQWLESEIAKGRGREGGGTLQADDSRQLSAGMDEESVPLFKGLSDAEIKRFVEAGKVIAFRKGETIVKAGYSGNELFVVLKGEVEARGNQNGVSVKLGSFGAGEVFGEISFLMQRRRTADVIGLTDGTLLEVSQSFLEEAMVRLPTLTMRVLLNLSLVLCERLCSTTVQLLLANSRTAGT